MSTTVRDATLMIEVRGRGARAFRPDEQLLVSVCGDEVPALSPAASVRPGDYVGIAYGWEWPTEPAALPTATARKSYGSEKSIKVPTAMTTELAFLLGAYMSEGHTSVSNWSVFITNSVPEVLQRAAAAWASEFGLRSRIDKSGDRCPTLVTSSKRLVEFMAQLGCGTRSSEKRVPPVITQSTQDHVLAFLQGVALDAYTTTATTTKWAICLDTAAGISDLQDLVTRLGVPNAQVAKWNKAYEKYYFELYCPGRSGQEMSRLVPFLEPDKAARAHQYQQATIVRSGASDVVPGISGKNLYDSIPPGRSGRNGRGTGRQRFRSLCDGRTRHLSRTSIEGAIAAGASAPDWLVDLLATDIRFAPVTAIGDSVGPRDRSIMFPHQGA